MNFFNEMMAFLTANPFFMAIMIVCVIALIGCIIAMVAVKKDRKNKDKVEKRVAEAEQKAKDEARAEAEQKAAARKAVFDRLDAQKEEAEKEEAQKVVEEKKTAKKSPAKKKSAPAQEEMAVAEEKKEEPAPAEEKPVEVKAEKKKVAKKATPAPVEEKKEEPAPAPAEEKKEEPVVEKKKTAKKPAKKAEPAPVEEKKEEPAPAPAEEKKEEPVVEKKKTAKKPAKKAEPAPVEEKKEEPAPAPVEEPSDESDTAVIARYAGKWIIYHILTSENNPEDEMFFFELHASNGEKLFSSEEYTSYNGAVKGIATYKANIAKDNFKIATTKKGDYIFKIMSGKNTLLCNGENYGTKVRCESAMKSTKRFARTAIIDENVRDLVVPVPTETDTEVAPLPEGLTGKWLISSRDVEDEKVYFFELFANNGEKLLSSEEYTTYSGAVNGIQTHKQNIAKGNFRISLTKNGDYIYKLLNGNNQLLCLGEHYKTKARCESAVESVKRFSANSPTLTDSDHVEEE